MTQLSTEWEVSAGYLWNRALVRELSEDAEEYERRRKVDRPVSQQTKSTDSLVPIRAYHQYSVREKYLEAREKQDPLLSPHGHFRALKFGSRKHALEFMSTFGALTWQPRVWKAGSVLYTRAKLEDFWAKHRRYCRVAALMENHSQPAELRSAFIELHGDLGLLDAADSFPVSLPPAIRNRNRGRLNLDREMFTAWLSVTSDEAVQALARHVVHGELIGQLHRRKPWWIKNEVELRFQLTLLSGTLWTMLWEMLAWDTNGGVFWRVCPHCGKLFYPPRIDRFYCTSEQQVLASKRQYAAQMRGKAKSNSRKEL